jgi:hypothetical protein
MAKHLWDEPAKVVEKAAEVAKNDVEAAAEEAYVHVPGTVHLNAFLADVKNCEKKVAAAVKELDAAKERLLQKKRESGMI